MLRCLPVAGVSDCQGARHEGGATGHEGEGVGHEGGASARRGSVRPAASDCKFVVKFVRATGESGRNEVRPGGEPGQPAYG